MKHLMKIIPATWLTFFSGMVSAKEFAAVKDLNDMAQTTVDNFLGFLGGSWVVGVITLILTVIGFMAITNKDQSNERKAALWAVGVGCLLILAAPVIAKVFGVMREANLT